MNLYIDRDPLGVQKWLARLSGMEAVAEERIFRDEDLIGKVGNLPDALNFLRDRLGKALLPCRIHRRRDRGFEIQVDDKLYYLAKDEGDKNHGEEDLQGQQDH